MTDLERVALERDDARELHREVVRHLVGQIAELTRERDRALACEAAALALLAEWRERVASPPPEGERCGECGVEVEIEGGLVKEHGWGMRCGRGGIRCGGSGRSGGSR